MKTKQGKQEHCGLNNKIKRNNERLNHNFVVYSIQFVLIWLSPSPLCLCGCPILPLQFIKCTNYCICKSFFPPLSLWAHPENVCWVYLISLGIALARKPPPSHQSTSIRWKFDWISSFPSVWEVLEVDKPDILCESVSQMSATRTIWERGMNSNLWFPAIVSGSESRGATHTCLVS